MGEEIDYQGIIPLEFKAAILIDEVQDKSAGGLYIPESEQRKQEHQADRGELVAFNEGFWLKKPGPKPEIGDRVIFNSYKGVLLPIRIDGIIRRLRLVNDEDIIAIDRSEKDDGK